MTDNILYYDFRIKKPYEKGEIVISKGDSYGIEEAITILPNNVGFATIHCKQDGRSYRDIIFNKKELESLGEAIKTILANWKE